MSKKRILCIIPARAGSKGLPGKNYKKLNDKPLFLHAVDVVKSIKYETDIVVSTDCDEVIRISNEKNVRILRRPESLSRDNSLVIDAIKFTVLEEEKKSEKYNYIILLEPTSPMRTSEILEECLDELLFNKDIKSVSTYSQTEIPPTRAWSIQNKIASPYIQSSNPWRPRQEHEIGYQLNGLFYGIGRDELMDSSNNSIVTAKHSAVITERKLSIDIDTIEDFEYVEFIMRLKSE